MPPPDCSGRVVLLGNPASARGAGAARLAAVEAALRSRGVELVVLRTERPAHAVELARSAAEGRAALLVVSGGDGTVRDAVEGLLGSAVPLGIVPGGTGNDLVRTLGIPADLDRAVTIALSERERTLDVWSWGGVPFLNVAGLGLDAAVATEVNERLRGLRGTLAYVVALMRVLPRFAPVPLALRWPEGEWSGSAWLAAFGNGQCYGGGMKITPAAVPDDGLLDVTVITGISRAELLRQFPKIFSGSHVQHPAVLTFMASRFEVDAPPQRATIDGELIGTVPALVEKVPAAIRVRVP
jgi:diacylglycerol kinase (ATP)